MAHDMIAEARGLNHRFGTGEARKQALFDIDLALPRRSLAVAPRGRVCKPHKGPFRIPER